MRIEQAFKFGNCDSDVSCVPSAYCVAEGSLPGELAAMSGQELWQRYRRGDIGIEWTYARELGSGGFVTRGAGTGASMV